MTLIWHPDTERELADEATKAASIIVTDPERAHECDPPYRKVTIERFLYQLIYEIRKDHLRLIAVMHQSRHPGY